MRTALVRSPSSHLEQGIVTHLERAPVRPERAAAQHAAYAAALSGAGWKVREVPPADELPDSAFVEDTVVVFDDLAVLARPGPQPRRDEVPGTAQTLRELGIETVGIDAPGMLDGGDVLQVGATVYCGLGGRTNEEGIRQLGEHARHRGRTVVPVPLREVLHLKSAVTALPDGTFLAADPALVDLTPFPQVRMVPEEAGSHVVLLGGDAVLMAASAPQTAELVTGWGFPVTTVDISEFEKMEGCVTCLSVLIEY